jgi:hypothetical protein
MANVILDSHSMDFTARIQHAQRSDGQWFTRIQYRDTRYGYKWSSWRAVANGPERGSDTGRTARLPRAAQ